MIFPAASRQRRAARPPRSTLVGQAGAALGAAAGQNLAAVAGGHTLAEAVLLGALTLFGLIGTKHGGHLLSLESVFVTENSGWARDFLAGRGEFSQQYAILCVLQKN